MPYELHHSLPAHTAQFIIITAQLRHALWNLTMQLITWSTYLATLFWNSFEDKGPWTLGLGLELSRYKVAVCLRCATLTQLPTLPAYIS